VTSKFESCNRFARWLSFGTDGVLADNDPAEQLIQLNTLLANLVIFHNAMSPYLRGRRLHVTTHCDCW
jgi:hypothetical protein